MKFDVLIIGIGDPKARNIVSKHVAHASGVTIQNALSMLDNLPVAFATSVTNDEAQLLIRQLDKINVAARMVDARPPQPIFRGGYLADKPKTKSQPEPNTPSVVPIHTKTPRSPDLIPPSQNGNLTAKKKIAAITMTGAAILFVLLLVFATARNKVNRSPILNLDWSKSGLAQQGLEKKKVRQKASTRIPRGSIDDKAVSRSDTSGSDKAAPESDIPPTDEQKQTAQAFLDSAQAAGSLDEAIKFFKFAIAFNKKNASAWQGLLDVYKSAGMENEAKETEERMKELFGDNVFSIAKLVEPYGTTVAMSRTQDGAYRVEYRSFETDQENALFKSYQLMRTITPLCRCKAVSLYIHTGGKKGLLVYIKTQPFPESYRDFKTTASITRLK
jgi:tetratricopeptide (TPR) repeat protein